MSKSRETLYIGVGGHIVSIDSATGEENWCTKLKNSSYATVHVVGKRLYGGAGGELFGLDPTTGKILWRNKLKGLGLGIVAFPGADVVAAAAAEAQQRAAAAAAAT